MIYRPFLLLIAILLGAVAEAQDFPIKLYEYPEDDRQGLFELAALPDGNMIMFGHHFASASATDRAGVILTLDAQGEHAAPPLKISGTPAQIKDALIRPDGSMVLLTGYQSATDFSNWFGLIWRDASGRVTRSRSWAGKAKAITWADDGGIFLVGSEQGTLGMFGLVSAEGELQSIQQILPEVRRPAGLIDAVTLSDGSIFAYGTMITSIEGVPQAEIITYRFSGGGAMLSAKKITRGVFFVGDGLSMFIRSPARIQLDADENIYLATYLGSGGNSWRTHLMRLRADGVVTRSRSYVQTDQYAGQGALHVTPDGISTFAFETIDRQEETNRSLTVLRVNFAGDKIISTRRRGPVFDVTSLLATPGGFAITGTTLACDSDERTTYLTHLTDGFQFLDDPCSEADMSLTILQVGIQSALPISIELRPMPVIFHPPPSLVPAEVNISEATCLTSNADELLQAFDTTVVLCPGERFVYDPLVSARTQVRWTDGTREISRAWDSTEPGTYELELDNNCTSVTHTITIASRTDVSELGPTRFLTRCDGESSVELSIPTNDEDNLVWEDGSTDNPRTVTESGTYGATVANVCGNRTILMVVQQARDQPLADRRETLIICHGDSLRYAPTLGAGITGVWAGLPADTAAAVWLSNAGVYTLERNDGCTTAMTEVTVRNQDCCSVYLPTAFSPNRDGVNDAYAPLLANEGCGSVGDVIMTVFNRWGGQVFNGTDLAWDGNLPDGTPAEVGAYVVALSYWNGAETIRRSNLVTLVR